MVELRKTLCDFYRGQTDKRLLGFSLLEVLVALCLVGFLATGLSNMFNQAYRNYRANNEKQELSATGNYFLQFTDCSKTALDTTYESACRYNRPVNLRDKDNNIILDTDGRNFDQFSVISRCDGGDIYLSAGSNETPSGFLPLLAGVPIVCGYSTVPKTTNPINMTVSFASAGKILSISIKLVADRSSTDAMGRLVTELKVDAITSQLTGGFSEDLADQLIAGDLTAKVIFDKRSSNAPFSFTAALSLKNLKVQGKNVGDQTFLMTQSGKSLNLENNEGIVQALQTEETKKTTDACKIKGTGAALTGRLAILTKPAPCAFNMPKIMVGYAAGHLGEVPIGTYWRYYYYKSYNKNTGTCGGNCTGGGLWGWDVTHPFSYLDPSVDPSHVAKIPNVKGSTNEKVTMDNGFLLAEPSGKVYLLADAGLGQKNYPANSFTKIWRSTENVAKDFIATLMSQYPSLYKNNFINLFQPAGDITFSKDSVIAVYDDTPDMSGAIDVNALTKFVVTYDTSLSWSIEEELPP